jgi:hypothetical protein
MATAAIASHFRAGIPAGKRAELGDCGAIDPGGCGVGFERAGLPVTPGMLGSCGLNGSCSLGLSDTVDRSVVILSLIWFAGICKRADALWVNGSAVSERGRRPHIFALF